MACVLICLTLAGLAAICWWLDGRGQATAADLSDVLRGRIDGVDPVDAHAEQAIAATTEPGHIDLRAKDDLGLTPARSDAPRSPRSKHCCTRRKHREKADDAHGRAGGAAARRT